MANTEKLSGALKNLEANLTRTYRSGWDGYWGFVDRFVRDPSSYSAIQRDYVSFVSQTMPTQMLGVLEAGTRCYSALVESGGQMVSDAYSRSTAVPAAASSPVPTVTEFLFEAHSGETAVKRFLVTNTSDSLQAVAFEVTDFQNDRGFSMAIPVMFDPAGFSLQPSQESVVTCTVKIPGEATAGTDYVATMSATGLPFMKVRLRARSLGPADIISATDDEIVIIEQDGQ